MNKTFTNAHKCVLRFMISRCLNVLQAIRFLFWKLVKFNIMKLYILFRSLHSTLNSIWTKNILAIDLLLKMLQHLKNILCSCKLQHGRPIWEKLVSCILFSVVSDDGVLIAYLFTLHFRKFSGSYLIYKIELELSNVLNEIF